MSNSKIRDKKPYNRPPITYPEWMVVINGCIPLVFLMFDARHHQLGVDPIRSALKITGSLSLILLFATLSITPARKITRWNSLHHFRRPLGLMTFLYALSHLAIYIGFDRNWDLADAWIEISQRRYLQMGSLSLLAMVPLALTSTPRMVRLMTMRRWKRLHRLIHLALFAAVVHFWMQSKADLRWQIASIAIALTLIGLRISAARKST